MSTQEKDPASAPGSEPNLGTKAAAAKAAPRREKKSEAKPAEAKSADAKPADAKAARAKAAPAKKAKRAEEKEPAAPKEHPVSGGHSGFLARHTAAANLLLQAGLVARWRKTYIWH